MASEYSNMDELTEERRRAIAESIRSISAEEMKALGESLFPSAEHPWREKYFAFVSENANANFYHAVTHDRIHMLYCDSPQKGIWFKPGSGMGPLQEIGLAALKEAVDSRV